MHNAIALNPRLFSRAWLNVYNLSKLGTEYEKAVIIEQHRRGVWLVAITPTACAASWVPVDETGVDTPPPFDNEPIEPAFFVGDADGRITQLMTYQWKKWKKENAEAGFDDFVHVMPIAAPKTDKPELPGLERPLVRVAVSTEHVDAPELAIPVPAWRSFFRTFEHGVRYDCSLPMEAMKALCTIEGCDTPRMEFGSGANALLTFEPSVGCLPTTIVHMAVGKRDEAPAIRQTDEPEDLTLTTQSYDEDDDSYADAEDDDAVYDDQLPAVGLTVTASDNPLAQQAATGILAGLGARS